MRAVVRCEPVSYTHLDVYKRQAQGTVDVTTLHIFGLPVDLIGFQGGIIVALLIGIVTAKLDIFFEKKVPEVIRLLVSPLLTTLVSSFLLFMVIGPVGRGLANGITTVLVWMTQHLGVIGYAAFSGDVYKRQEEILMQRLLRSMCRQQRIIQIGTRNIT